MKLAASGIITRVLDHQVISGKPTTKVAIDQEHLGIRCIRLFMDLGDDCVGKDILVNLSNNPLDEKRVYQEIMLDGNYQKVSYLL